MKQQSIASPADTIGCPACEAPPDERYATGRGPSGRPRPFASEFHPVRPTPAASAR
jgi:hypothetical protein